MNYQKHYDALIARARVRHIDEYTETHHIIPECFFKNRKRKGKTGHLDGNPNNIENLVELTPEEHFLAHQLLVKLHPGNTSMVFAATMMLVDSNGTRINNKRYGWLRRKHRDAMSITHAGRKNSAEHNRKISIAKIGMPRPDVAARLLGVKRPDLSESNKKLKKGNTYGAANKGKKYPNKVINIIECPHCSKVGSASNMKRYHFDNCKAKIYD